VLDVAEWAKGLFKSQQNRSEGNDEPVAPKLKEAKNFASQQLKQVNRQTSPHSKNHPNFRIIAIPLLTPPLIS
jgi:hypothetical protein